MSDRRGAISRLVSLAGSPGYREDLLGVYAAFCILAAFDGAFAFFMPQIAALSDEARWALSPVQLPLILSIPAFVLWFRRRPPRRVTSDPRVWFLALLGCPGVVSVGLFLGKHRGTGLLLTVALSLLAFALASAVTLWVRSRRESRRRLIERKEWRISQVEEAGLDVESALLEEMSPGRRLLHRIIPGACFLIVFLSVMGLFSGTQGGKSPGPLSIALCFCGAMGAPLVLYRYYSNIVRHQLVHKKQVEYELDAARRMQMSLMPTGAPHVQGLDIAGVTAPALEVGGDLFHYYDPPESHGSAGIVLADVSGKGMKAAIAAVLVSGMLRAERDRWDSPAGLLATINRGLLGGMGAAGFVAMQVLVVDGRTRQAHYSNAGQVHPLLLRKGTVETLELSGIPLGIEDAPAHEESRLSLEAGDVLFLMSDGIPEATNEKKELLGFERVEEMVRRLDASASAADLRDELIAKARAFQGKASQSDDMTLVCVKVVA